MQGIARSILLSFREKKDVETFSRWLSILWDDSSHMRRPFLSIESKSRKGLLYTHLDSLRYDIRLRDAEEKYK